MTTTRPAPRDTDFCQRPARLAPREVGRRGEQIAARYLTDLGWQVLERNWRPSSGRRGGQRRPGQQPGPGAPGAPGPADQAPDGPRLRGELDIIALQPRDGSRPRLVVIEVKTRTSTRLGPPGAAVDARKVARLRALAGAWAASHEVPHEGLRLDVISLLLRPGQPVFLRHHEGVGEG